ncbi:MAG TPA: hypothetical protein GXX42_06310 [Petrimonas sp.]|uniref:hypothetical protein n=1 Tax=Petrimonas sp. TaxID=2023866 RepID=UPI000961E708|nr:MAG: hypothetical protein BGO33_01095 [Bacteroidia bacterium 43-41]HHV85412.1 hypothetical protein [Petrimonas sp.]
MNTLLVRNFRSFFVESRFISLVVSIAVIALRFLMFLKKGLPDFQISSTGFVWPYIEPVFQKYPLVSFLSSTLSVFIISYLISELNVRYGVIRMRTSMPFYVPLILFSVHPFFLRMTPDFPALIFILWSLFPLLASYQYHHSHRCAYQFSALIAIAGIFQIHALLFLPLWVIGLSAMGGLSFRSFIASIFGIILVYWIVFVFYVFGDNISGFIVPFQRLAEIYDFTQPSSLSVPQWGFIGLILLFLFFIIIADGKQITRERSFTKKVLVFSISVILVSFLLQTLYLNQTFIWLYVIISFFSIIAAHFYTNTTFRPEILSYFLVLILLAFYYCLNLFTDLSPF